MGRISLGRNEKKYKNKHVTGTISTNTRRQVRMTLNSSGLTTNQLSKYDAVVDLEQTWTLETTYL